MALGQRLGKPFRHISAVRSVAFSPDGATILTGSSNRISFWDIQPMRGDAQQIQLWIEANSGMELDELDLPRALDVQQWLRRRQELVKLESRHQ